jgi:K+-transporting ATPase c subunit
MRRPSLSNRHQREPDPKDSAKTISVPYTADNSSGSKLGPTSKALMDRIKGDAEKLQAENPNTPVPVDLVTTSASGLDPDITRRARSSKCRALPKRGQFRKIKSGSLCRHRYRRYRRAVRRRAEAEYGARGHAEPGEMNYA